MKQVVITQPKHVDSVIEAFKIMKGAPNPALTILMADEPNSLALEDQTNYMSKCMMLVFLSQCSYPEIHPAVINLSTKYNQASEESIKR